MALGAACIEKHATLDHADGGVYSEFSLNPEKLTLLTREAKAACPRSARQVALPPPRSRSPWAEPSAGTSRGVPR